MEPRCLYSWYTDYFPEYDAKPARKKFDTKLKEREQENPNKYPIPKKKIEVDYTRIFKDLKPLNDCKCFLRPDEELQIAFPPESTPSVPKARVEVEPMEINSPVPGPSSSPAPQPPSTTVLQSPSTTKVVDKEITVVASLTISDDEPEDDLILRNDFKTALEIVNEQEGRPTRKANKNRSVFDTLPPPRSLGLRPPNRNQKETSPPPSSTSDKLNGLDKELITKIENEMMGNVASVTWDDIAGLEYPKQIIHETVVMPQLRPDLFTGLRRPAKGILLFGPPGTGKTLIGKCIASQSNSKFFSITASTLTSKWIGEGEKLVRTLFQVAAVHQPSVVFIDEIDSMLSKRSDNEHEASRRMKTEFMTSMDGATTKDEDRVLIIGATNRPQELDDAVRRRLVKRLYIPLPDEKARVDMLRRMLASERNSLSDEELTELAKATEGYSGADMKELCSNAALGPIRDYTMEDLSKVQGSDVRPVNISDFQMALKRVKATVDKAELDAYVQWDNTFGSGL